MHTDTHIKIYFIADGGDGDGDMELIPAKQRHFEPSKTKQQNGKALKIFDKPFD